MAILGVNPVNPSGVISGFSVSFCMLCGGFQRSAKMRTRPMCSDYRPAVASLQVEKSKIKKFVKKTPKILMIDRMILSLALSEHPFEPEGIENASPQSSR